MRSEFVGRAGPCAPPREVTRPDAPARRKKIRLPADAYHKPGVWYFVTICCRNKEARLRERGARDLVVQVLRQTAVAQRSEVAAYSVLPNHLHLICSAGKNGLVAFVRKFKSRTALEIRRRTGASSPWQKSFFDHKLRSEESLRQKCAYVWMNPVRRRLVSRPEDYPWNGSLLIE